MANSQQTRDRAVEATLLSVPTIEATLDSLLRRIEGTDDSTLDLLEELLTQLSPYDAVCSALLEVAITTYGVEHCRGRYQDVTPGDLREHPSWWTDLFGNLLQGTAMTIEVARSYRSDADRRDFELWSRRALWSLALMAGVFTAVWGARPRLLRLLVERTAGIASSAERINTTKVGNGQSSTGFDLQEDDELCLRSSAHSLARV